MVISAGPEKVTVPDVAGWKQEHAQKLLEALGFKVTVAKVQVSQFERGLVEDTDPVAGSSLDYGSAITLRVSDVEPTTTTEATTEATTTTTNFLDRFW